jgi:hypothetical protein
VHELVHLAEGVTQHPTATDGQAAVRFHVLAATSTKMTVFWVFGRVVWYRFTDVSQVFTASIVKAMLLHGATSQKTNTFILVAVKTGNLT